MALKISPPPKAYFLFKEESKYDQIINEIASLPTNWDGEDALAPHPNAVANAREWIRALINLNEEIYHIAPGPAGEILVNLRQNNKSLEMLFYPQKNKFVRISFNEKPTQGELKMEDLIQHLNWLKL